MTNPTRFLMHVPVPWVFVLAYLLGLIPESFHHRVLSPGAALVSTIVGGILFGLGAVIAGWGLLLFRKASTTTVPGKLSAQLVTGGP